MPEIQRGVLTTEKVKGRAVIEAGVTKVDGKPVDPNGNYKRKIVVAQPINHNRRMKKLYNQFGVAGVNAYGKAVQQYQDKKSEVTSGG